MHTLLSQNELERYSRTIMLDEIGIEGQKKLRQAHVAIVGAGALGSIVAMRLAAAGIGHLNIADSDTIELSNLPRQIAYDTESVGLPKLDVLGSRLSAANPDVRLTLTDGRLSAEDMAGFISGADVCVDASDNNATKQALTQTARSLGIPCVLGGIDGFKGQVITFDPSSRLAYADIFGSADEAPTTPPAPRGIFSPVPSVVGSLQTAEVIKIITGVGTPLINRLLCLDTLDMSFNIYNL